MHKYLIPAPPNSPELLFPTSPNPPRHAPPHRGYEAAAGTRPPQTPASGRDHGAARAQIHPGGSVGERRERGSTLAASSSWRWRVAQRGSNRRLPPSIGEQLGADPTTASSWRWRAARHGSTRRLRPPGLPSPPCMVYESICGISICG